MRHPIPVTCDVCQRPIDEPEKMTTVNQSMPPDVADDIHEEWKRDSAGHQRYQILGFQMPVQRPTHIQLDLCSDCEDPRYRDAAALKASELLKRKREDAQKADARPQYKDED